MVSRLTYTRWLMQYRSEDTAVGDLARRIARDAEWEDPPTQAALESMLRGAG